MAQKDWSQRVWANLPVKDTARTRTFYKALGFKINKGYDGGDMLTSFIIGKDGFVIHFFAEKHLKQAVGGVISNAKKGAEIIFTFGVSAKKEVDKWAGKVVKAGGKVFQKPVELNGMYSCGFMDPDGHRWNILAM
jgi:uncharacterized protein